MPTPAPSTVAARLATFNRWLRWGGVVVLLPVDLWLAWETLKTFF